MHITYPYKTLSRHFANHLYKQLYLQDLDFVIWSDKELLIDLREVAFITPSGVTSLIAAAKHWSNLTLGRTCLLNLQTQVFAYLERVNIFEILDFLIFSKQILQSDQKYSRSSASLRVMELVKISSNLSINPKDVSCVIGHAQRILEHRYGGEHDEIDRLILLLSELAQNVTHSESDGFAIVQSYFDQNGLERKVELSIVDFGIGIQESLVRANKLPPDSSLKTSGFIKYALGDGISGVGPNRGLGLWKVQKDVKRWDGLLHIRSNDGEVIIDPNGDSYRDQLPLIKGTQVTIVVKGSYQKS